MIDDEDEARKFMEMVFGRQPDETCPALVRNKDCEFTQKVLNYLEVEWEIRLLDYPHHVQDRAIDMIDTLKGKENVPNAAARVSMEKIPI